MFMRSCAKCRQIGFERKKNQLGLSNMVQNEKVRIKIKVKGEIKIKIIIQHQQ